MKKSRVIPILALVVMLLSLAATASASTAKNFRTHLTGEAEVPVVVTDAQGKAFVKVDKDGDSLHFRVVVISIHDVTAAHIHLGPPDGTGGVVVWLYPRSAPGVLIPGPSNGVLAEGDITEGDLVGALAGQPLQSLIDAIAAGNTYVNVHTSANPGGEIRGQLHDH